MPQWALALRDSPWQPSPPSFQIMFHQLWFQMIKFWEILCQSAPVLYFPWWIHVLFLLHLWLGPTDKQMLKIGTTPDQNVVFSLFFGKCYIFSMSCLDMAKKVLVPCSLFILACTSGVFNQLHANFVYKQH